MFLEPQPVRASAAIAARTTKPGLPILQDEKGSCCMAAVFAAERIGGNRDDWDRSQLRIGFNPAGRCITVHDRELNIHQDEIGPLRCDCRQRQLTVFGLRNFVVSRGQHIADDLAIIRLVVDHQNALAHVVFTYRFLYHGHLPKI